MDSLIERIEAATEDQQYDLLCAAFEVVKGKIRDTESRPGFTRWHDDWFVFERKLKAFAFIDAAMTLVPANWTAWELRSHSARTRFSADLSRLSECDSSEEDWAYGRGATPALALCAAALKARTIPHDR